MPKKASNWGRNEALCVTLLTSNSYFLMQKPFVLFISHTNILGNISISLPTFGAVEICVCIAAYLWVAKYLRLVDKGEFEIAWYVSGALLNTRLNFLLTW